MRLLLLIWFQKEFEQQFWERNFFEATSICSPVFFSTPLNEKIQRSQTRGFPRDLEPQVSEPGILCFDSEEHSILVILVSELCETKIEGFWKDCYVFQQFWGEFFDKRGLLARFHVE